MSLTVKQVREMIAGLPDDAQFFTQDEMGYVYEASQVACITVALSPVKNKAGDFIHDELMPDEVRKELLNRKRVKGLIIR